MSDQVDLEIKTAFLERTLDTLNEVVLEQGNIIDRLERRLDSLEKRIKAMREGEDEVGPHDEQPPHY